MSTNSLERALRIIDLVAATPGGLTLSTITRRLQIPLSSSHYVLSRLERHGYLSRHKDTRCYETGIKLVAVAHAPLRDMRLRGTAESVMHRLAEETKLGAFVGVLAGSAVMIVARVERPGPLAMDMEIGVRYPAHRTALGKVLLGSLSDEEVLALYGVARKKRLTGPVARLIHELNAVRRRGYGTNEEELFPGIRAVAAPVVGKSGDTMCAVSATGPNCRVDDHRIINAVKAAGRQIGQGSRAGRQ